MLIGGTIIWVVAAASLAWWSEKWALPFLALILPTYLVRLTIVGIPTTWLELAIYAIFIVWLVKNSPRNFTWWKPILPYFFPLALLGLGLLIGVVVSSDRLISLGVAKGWFFDPLLLFIMVANAGKVRSPREEFNNIGLGLGLSGLILASVALGQVISGHFITIDQRASAWFSSANYLSLYLVPIMILILGWWQGAPRYIRWVVSFGWLIMLVALYFTFSYAGWLALIAGVLIFWWLLSPSIKWGLIGLLGILVAVASQWQSAKFQHIWDLMGRSSAHVRLQVWQTAFLMVKENWFTGIGLGLFEKRYAEAANRLFHPPLEPVVLHAHNIWLQFWLNTGLTGLIGFGWLLVEWFKKIWPGVKARSSYGIAVFSAMVALLVHGMVDTAYWKNDLSALFWIIVGLGIMLSGAYGRESLSDRD